MLLGLQVTYHIPRKVEDLFFSRYVPGAENDSLRDVPIGYGENIIESGVFFVIFAMVKWKILYTNRAQEDSLKLKKAGLKKNAENPYQTAPPFEKLLGLRDTYSRRINIQHRLVYQINDDSKQIIVKMMYKQQG